MKCALIDAAVVVAAFATPALSPVVTEDPDYCAQFYLNEKCQNPGPGNPYTDGVYYHNDPAQTAEPNAHCNRTGIMAD
jgi:hypothetical protein